MRNGELRTGADAVTVFTMNYTLKEAIADAMDTLTEETRLDANALFGERVLEPAQMSAPAAFAAGLIEGAAIMAGMTALELVDEWTAS